MQGQATRDKADAVLSELVQMFESGQLPEAIAQTRIVRERHDRPLCEWSLGNQLLALAHNTDDARGFRQWEQAGRHVRKGSRAFFILGPCKVKRTEVDESGGEEVERVFVAGFRAIPVFRAADTDGEPLEYPDYSPAEPPELADVAERLGVPVRYLPNGGGARGAYNVVRGDITLATHDVDTFFHELGHAAHATLEPLRGGQNPRQEIIAEVVSAVLCRLYGYDGYLAESRDYVAFYAGHDEPGKAVVRLVADVAKVLDVILGEGASAPSPVPAGADRVRALSVKEAQARLETFETELAPVFERLEQEADGMFGSPAERRAEQARRNKAGSKQDRLGRRTVTEDEAAWIGRRLTQIRTVQTDNPTLARIQTLLRERDELAAFVEEETTGKAGREFLGEPVAA